MVTTGALIGLTRAAAPVHRDALPALCRQRLLYPESDYFVCVTWDGAGAGAGADGPASVGALGQAAAVATAIHAQIAQRQRAEMI